MIKSITFDHGWFYRYRFHSTNLDKLKGMFTKLKTYLKGIEQTCPHQNFASEPRGSSLRFTLTNPRVHEIKGHEISELAQLALQNRTHNGAARSNSHSTIQTFMLESDQKTLATEIPVWLWPGDLSVFKQLFSSTKPLTGHIDLIRKEGNQIWVWDYKPQAAQEKWAATQVFFYSLMLSKRTAIPLEHFRCGYFDQHRAFIFKPELKLLKKEEMSMKISK